MIVIQQMHKEVIYRLGEIDRSEHVRLIYRYAGGSIYPVETDIPVSHWSEQEVQAHIEKLIPELDQGGALFGALDGNLLVGIAVLGNRFIGENQDQLQLVFLHVSQGYRRQGVATQLLAEAAKLAREKGATSLYISSTESESAVGFYRGQGARLAPQVDEALYALEPEDIHMTLDL